MTVLGQGFKNRLDVDVLDLRPQAYLFIASRKLGMFQRQMRVASVPYEKVISKCDMLISVLSYVSVDGCAI